MNIRLTTGGEYMATLPVDPLPPDALRRLLVDELIGDPDYDQEKGGCPDATA